MKRCAEDASLGAPGMATAPGMAKVLEIPHRFSPQTTRPWARSGREPPLSAGGVVHLTGTIGSARAVVARRRRGRDRGQAGIATRVAAHRTLEVLQNRVAGDCGARSADD